ncbi:ribosomal RNA small subunit methyltransferase I [Capnocytophaga sp. HP1101]
MSKLYLIPTPIGNLEDITLRALRLLKEVDIILAEDTRTSSKLLKHYDIHTPMQSYHLFNEHKVVDSWVQRIKTGTTVALITDAGTPAISDPGFLLTRACLAESVAVECLPGATAFVPALVNSGLPNDRFTFEGFLPDKKGRQTRLSQLSSETKTMIFYISPHKLLKTLTDFISTFGADRLASLSRELTKLHEETQRGTLQELFDFYKDKNIKGEIVLIISGKK